MTCPFVKKCWRYAYSVYLMKHQYVIPPTRMVLFCDGMVSGEMMNKSYGIFADNMPSYQQGKMVNVCPSLDGSHLDCHEYKKHQKLLDRLEQKRGHRQAGMRPRVFLSRELRQQVAVRDNYQCVYCGAYVGQYRNGQRVRGVVDHFIPLFQGGDEKDIDNLVLSCHECNAAKGTEIWERGCRVDFY